ncbi:dephospho-CoA kinase [Pullulanibacillus pueri]|uniref:Shikimate kinase n=1 Tax=Pullulanibacillus pueri TaxID=1437324 RepID=A0A8J2ZU04_9BACL|nr:AAA family ATPase [Pullulanibacillus pueri]MBM7680796.1 dephospho-CoA kinase [Pullulanibacillus pueri]GGH78367.1 shikimate kinase [Pullulanibacillus pueri]
MKLVFFVGTAGTGKSYVSQMLSQEFSWAYLDMDTIGTPFVNKMLTMNGLDPDDRDSKFYKEHLRDLPYRATMDVALDNLLAHQNVALIGPFTRELANPEWIEKELKAKGLSFEEVDVKVIIVEVNNPNVEKERIQERGFERDQWKLNHWQEYKSEKKEYHVTWNIPETSVLRFDNSDEMTEEKRQTLIDFIKE